MKWTQIVNLLCKTLMKIFIEIIHSTCSCSYIWSKWEFTNLWYAIYRPNVVVQSLGLCILFSFPCLLSAISSFFPFIFPLFRFSFLPHLIETRWIICVHFILFMQRIQKADGDKQCSVEATNRKRRKLLSFLSLTSSFFRIVPDGRIPSICL